MTRKISGLAMLSVGAWWAALSATLAAQAPEEGGKDLPTFPYVSKAFGFEVRLPAGWNYDHAGFFGPGGSMGLLRGAAPSGQVALQVLVFRDLEQPGFREWIEYFSGQLGSLEGARGVRVQGVESAKRPTANVVAEAQDGLIRSRSAYHCVQFDEDVIWVLVYAEAARETSEEPFDPGGELEIPAGMSALVKSLRVFYDPEIARGTAQALQRGRQYLAGFQLQEAAHQLRLDESVRYYEIQLAGKAIGYLTRQATREFEPLQNPGRVSNAKPGIRIRERSYRFADDGVVHYSQNDLFSSRDGETDLYEMVQIRIPPTDKPEEKVLIMQDQCIRESDTLFSTYTTNRDAALPEPRQPIKLSSGYLGLAWARVLPALLGRGQTEPIAFSLYDAETRTLITQTIRPLGEKSYAKAPADKVFAYEIREGFTEKPGIVYTDADGNLLRFEADTLVFTLADEKTIEQRYGQRREAANRRLQAQRRP